MRSMLPWSSSGGQGAGIALDQLEPGSMPGAGSGRRAGSPAGITAPGVGHADGQLPGGNPDVGDLAVVSTRRSKALWLWPLTPARRRSGVSGRVGEQDHVELLLQAGDVVAEGLAGRCRAFCGSCELAPRRRPEIFQVQKVDHSATPAISAASFGRYGASLSREVLTTSSSGKFSS